MSSVSTYFVMFVDSEINWTCKKGKKCTKHSKIISCVDFLLHSAVRGQREAILIRCPLKKRFFIWMGLYEWRQQEETTWTGLLTANTATAEPASRKWYSPSDLGNRWCRCHQQAPVKQHRNTRRASRTLTVLRIPPFPRQQLRSPAPRFLGHCVWNCERRRQRLTHLL